MSFDSSWVPNIYKASGDVYHVWWTNNLQYNPVWQWLQNVTNWRFINIYCFHFPTLQECNRYIDFTNPSRYNTVFLTWQNQYTTLAAAQAEDPRSLN
jgi:hypothetical protein